ncbi:MAG: hypothetical protein V4479_04475, partial [Actinomycetota bacterium]
MSVFSRWSIRVRITIGSVLVAAVFFGATMVAVRLEVKSILQDTDSSLAASFRRQDPVSKGDEIMEERHRTQSQEGREPRPQDQGR